MLFNDLPGKVLQCGLIGNITHIMVAFCGIYDTHVGALFFEFLRDTFADSGRTAGYNHYFVLKHGNSPFFFIQYITGIPSMSPKKIGISPVYAAQVA